MAFVFALCTGCSQTLTNSQIKIAGTVVTVNKTTPNDLEKAGFEILRIDCNRNQGYHLSSFVGSQNERVYIRLQKDGYVIYAGFNGQSKILGDTPMFDFQWLPRSSGTPEDASILVGSYAIKKGMTREEVSALLEDVVENQTNLGPIYNFEDAGVSHEMLYDENDVLRSYIVCDLS